MNWPWLSKCQIHFYQKELPGPGPLSCQIFLQTIRFSLSLICFPVALGQELNLVGNKTMRSFPFSCASLSDFGHHFYTSLFHSGLGETFWMKIWNALFWFPWPRSSSNERCQKPQSQKLLNAPMSLDMLSLFLLLPLSKDDFCVNTVRIKKRLWNLVEIDLFSI